MPSFPAQSGHFPLKQLTAVADHAQHAGQELRDRIALKRTQRRTLPVLREENVMYESFGGSGILCNPEAIFQELLQTPDFSHLQHIWALDPETLQKYQNTKYAIQKNVKLVERNSAEYWKYVSSSKYLINNAGFESDFCKRNGQVYINTWHGTPLKRMGYDLPNGSLQAGKTVSNLLQSDYILSSSPYMTDRLLHTGFRIGNLYTGEMLNLGTPRIDKQFQENIYKETSERLCTAGFNISDNRKLLLYAPTWRGLFRAPKNEARLLAERVETLQSHLDPESYIVLLKIHQKAYEQAVNDKKLRSIIVPNEIPTNNLLSITDSLITDYSSIFFDFLAKGRPTYFYTPDIESYRSERGFYLDEQEWPGPISRTLSELADDIQKHEVEPYHRLQEAKELFAPREDGHASKRFVDAIFRGNHDNVTDLPKSKETIWITAGSADGEAPTESLIALLETIDHDTYDVSLHLSKFDQSLVKRIDKRVRVIANAVTFGNDEVERNTPQQLQSGIILTPSGSKHARWLLSREWQRTYGNAHFDFAIDYNGTQAESATLAAQATAEIRSIWLRYDMSLKRRRDIHEDPNGKSESTSVIALYSEFDNLVSVTSELSHINKQNLMDANPGANFSFANDPLDIDNIRDIFQTADPLVTRRARQDVVSIDPHDLQALAKVIVDNHDTDLALRTISQFQARKAYLGPSDVHTFITIAPFLPQNNHRRLLRAFTQVHNQHPKTELILVGIGPQEKWLRKLSRNYGVEDCVKFAGVQTSPYDFLALSDTIVASGDYSGQPIPLLAARLLRIKTVTTRFPSAKTLLAPQSYIVNHTVRDLAKAMESTLFSDDPEPWDTFDEYNQQALTQFHKAIGTKRRK